jgi:hypothetical protein
LASVEKWREASSGGIRQTFCLPFPHLSFRQTSTEAPRSKRHRCTTTSRIPSAYSHRLPSCPHLTSHPKPKVLAFWVSTFSSPSTRLCDDGTTRRMIARSPSTSHWYPTSPSCLRVDLSPFPTPHFGRMSTNFAFFPSLELFYTISPVSKQATDSYTSTAGGGGGGGGGGRAILESRKYRRQK